MAINRFNTHEPIKGGYTVIWNCGANDSSLSPKAKGILWYLLSKPPDWQVYEKDIVNNMKAGARAVRSGIKELLNAEYITRKRVFKENGQFDGWQYDVYHLPQGQKPQQVKAKTHIYPTGHHPEPVVGSHGLTGEQLEATHSLAAISNRGQKEAIPGIVGNVTGPF